MDLGFWIPIILGIVFVLIMVRLLPHLVYELAFFGAIFATFEWTKYWGEAILSIPPLPESVYIFTAAFAATWIILRLLLITSLFVPQMKIITMIIEGK